MKAAKDMDVLKKVDGRCDVTTGVDVIFVHGAETDAEQCWHPAGHPELSLPRMIARDLPYVCSWSLGYTSTLYRRKGYTLPLGEQASQTTRELANRSIGRRPIIFVAHSVGGLLIKHVLRLAVESQDQEWRRIVDQTIGVVFLSTPHFGFSMVRLARWLSYVPLLNNTLLADVLDLEGLRKLNGDFLKIVAKHTINVDAYYEGKPSPRLLWLAKMVNKESADPLIPGRKATALNADHKNVCRPPKPNDHVHVSIRQFIRRCFAGPAKDIFISYAHEDITSVDALRKHLEPLVREVLPRIWTDQSIRTGDAWETDIVKHMESSRVTVLILSEAFLKSDFIIETELPFLRRKADTEGLELICVFLAPLDLEKLSFKYSLPEGGKKIFNLNDVQWANKPDQPIETMSPTEKDKFFERLAGDIIRLSSPQSNQ